MLTQKSRKCNRFECFISVCDCEQTVDDVDVFQISDGMRGSCEEAVLLVGTGIHRYR